MRSSYLGTVLRQFRAEPGSWRLAISWLILYASGRFWILRAIRRARDVRTGLDEPRVTAPSDITLFDAVDVPAVVSRLRRDGVFRGLDLPPDVLRDIVTSSRERSRVPKGAAPDVLEDYESPSTLAAVRRLSSDPTLREIARVSFGREPICLGSRLFWKRAGHVAASDQTRVGHLFHFDVYDYQALNFFFYLTDVDQDCSPHSCVLGTHRTKRMSHQISPWRHVSDRSIFAAYGSNRVLTVTGPAGTGMVEDPFVFHRVVPEARKDRLMLQIAFAVRDFHVTRLS